MANLTQAEIDALIAKLKRFPYLAYAGATSLGPLSAAPSIAPDTETQDVSLYETAGETQASFLVKNNLTVTIKTRDVATAMGLQEAFVKGDNVLAAAKKVSLTLVPITGGTAESTITFPNAYLKPGLTFTPGDDGAPSEVELCYTCIAGSTTGKPFSVS